MGRSASPKYQQPLARQLLRAYGQGYAISSETWKRSEMSREISDVIERIDEEEGGTTAVNALEDGKVLFFPNLSFPLKDSEHRFLSPDYADPAAKHISFDPNTGAMKHAVGTESDLVEIAAMIRRYYQFARSLMCTMLPSYAEALHAGRTSFRPVEISGRKSSPRKDDSQLHVDAFPSSPVGGRRILRVFSNVNPDNHSRFWRIGESFETVAQLFVGNIRAPLWGSAWLMKAIGVTKSYRTRYDHLMLAIHDAMKLDDEYQRRAMQNEFHFPAGSTWAAYTDQVSHAAIAGRHAFEQTFYLPVRSMADEAKAPLRVLERLTGRSLV
jgi:3-deoxy-D-manno-oct-2-ulosonic acid (Kdo) hydroxylase